MEKCLSYKFHTFLQNEFNRISKVFYSCFGIEIGISSLKKGKKWYEKKMLAIQFPALFPFPPPPPLLIFIFEITNHFVRLS